MQRLELMMVTYLEIMIKNGIRSKIRMTKTEVFATLMRVSNMTLQQRLLLQAALQRLPEPRRSERSMPALKPRRAQPNGPPTTCVGH